MLWLWSEKLHYIPGGTFHTEQEAENVKGGEEGGGDGGKPERCDEIVYGMGSVVVGSKCGLAVVHRVSLRLI